MGDLKIKGASDRRLIKEFTYHLLRDLRALEIMIENDMFETDARRIGIEQELCLVDEHWRPAPINLEMLREINDPHFTTELARFNLEINLDPVELSGNCFSRMETRLNAYLKRAEKAARKYNSDVVLTGILPTIRIDDVEFSNITPKERYFELFKGLRHLRGGPFEYYIKGVDELIASQEYPTLEFCNTSFQVHIQICPEQFVNAYNFSKLITAPVLAAATNSPLLMGKRLWQETRITLFQQAIDTRHIFHHMRVTDARVSFPRQWIKHSPLEIFRNDIARFRILLCSEEQEDALKKVERGEIPQLYALRIFNGTVYRWNRACYGISNGKPHLRIENRVLPAGPTVIDEVANAAFWCGLMNGIPSAYENLPDKLDFDQAVTNFMKAARIGLDSHFYWITGKMVAARELILKELLPIAQSGLEKANINAEDIRQYLGIIKERVKAQKTGAQWILDSFSKLKKEGSQDEALLAITAGMANRQKKGIPVHKWKLAQLKESGNWLNNLWRVEQIMTTDLFTVQTEDLANLAIKIMEWKQVRHIPVENEKGNLVGLITAGSLLKYYNAFAENSLLSAEAVMIKDPIFVSPETSTLEAITIMRKNNIGCLPVVKNDKLIGIITEHDYMKIAARLLQDLFHGNTAKKKGTR